MSRILFDAFDVAGAVALSVDVAEVVTVTDSVKVVVTPLAVHAAETSTIVENVMRSLAGVGQLTVMVNDTVAVADAVTAAVTPLLGQVSESVASVDVARVGVNLGRVLSESVTVADAARVGVNLHVAVVDEFIDYILIPVQ